MINGFIKLPNRVIRGGHGATKLAVLCAVMSRGKCWASAQTLANDTGCCERTVRRSFKYWKEFGKGNGWLVWEQSQGKGRTYLVHVSFPDLSQIPATSDGESEGVGLSYRVPRTLVPIKKNPKEEYNKKVGGSSLKKPKYTIDGDLAYKDERDIWRVKIHTGEWREYTGPIEGHLETQ